MTELILSILFCGFVMGIPLWLLVRVQRERNRRQNLLEGPSAMSGGDGVTGFPTTADGSSPPHHGHDHGGFPGMGDGGGAAGGHGGGGGGGHGGH